MLQVSSIEKKIDQYVLGLKKRGIDNPEGLLKEVLSLDKRRKELQSQLDQVLQESNTLAKQIGNLFQQNKNEEAEKVKIKTSELKKESKLLNTELHSVETFLTTQLYNIPNIPHDSVSFGNSSKDNTIIKSVEENTPSLRNSKKPHWELIEEFNIVDFELGNKVSGAGFPFYINQGAKLIRGMINYFLDQATTSGYIEIQPPIVINEASGLGTGQFPDKEGQMYTLQPSNLYLIPTAEVPITNMYRGNIIKEEQLPIKHAGHTPCFRREAGSWGSHVRGLNRLHQFDKVEIVQIVEPSKSYQVLDEMVNHVEALIKSLNLPYRILRLCGGDTGFTAALTYDFEVFSAAQEKWLEVSSVSNFETYQANRLKLRIMNKEGKKELAHTLNGSALALPRIIAALLENNQAKDHIKLPEILHPYLGFKEIRKNK